MNMTIGADSGFSVARFYEPMKPKVGAKYKIVIPKLKALTKV